MSISNKKYLDELEGKTILFVFDNLDKKLGYPHNYYKRFSIYNHHSIKFSEITKLEDKAFIINVLLDLQRDTVKITELKGILKEALVYLFKVYGISSGPYSEQRVCNCHLTIENFLRAHKFSIEKDLITIHLLIIDPLISKGDKIPDKCCLCN